MSPTRHQLRHPGGGCGHPASVFQRFGWNPANSPLPSIGALMDRSVPRGDMVAADGLPQVGSKVRLNASTWNGPTVVEGVLLSPSAEGCITVKLLNGYNVTHRLENVTELEVVAGPDAESAGDEGGVVEDAGLPVVFILHTGGTIASKVDYSTGAVTARFEPEELLAAVPALARHARIRTRKLGNMWSDDIRPRHWNRMPARLPRRSRKEPRVWSSPMAPTRCTSLPRRSHSPSQGKGADLPAGSPSPGHRGPRTVDPQMECRISSLPFTGLLSVQSPPGGAPIPRRSSCTPVRMMA